MRLTLLIFVAMIFGVVLGTMFGYQMGTAPEWSIESESLAKLAENTPRPVSEPKADSPKVVVEEKTFDFGILQRDQGGKHDFIVKNEGKSPLTLKLAHKSCSCTSVAISSSQLAPGEQGKITLSWDNRQSFGGMYRQGASFLTNDPATPEFILNIAGVYSAPIVVSPQPILMQGVMAGTPNSRTFRLYGFEPMPLEIKGAKWNDQEHFKMEFTKSELTESERENRFFKGAKAVYDGKVTVEPGLPFGHFRETFELVSNSTADPHFKINLEGQMIGNLQFISSDYSKEQGILAMGRTSRGIPIQKTLTIKFAQQGTTPVHFEIESIKPDWIKASLGEILGEGSSRLVPLTVEIPHDAYLGTFLGPDPEQYGEIMLKTDLPGLESIRIPVSFVVEGGI